MDPLLIPSYIIITLLGLVVGSFLNVCILRIPAGESIVTGPSHCMSCGKRLNWWELIPLVSFIALRGRCSACHSKISPQYPLIEGSNGMLWFLVFLVKGFNLDSVLGCAFASVLLVLAVIDARTKEIPFSLNICILVLGAGRTVLHFESFWSHILGFVVVSLVLLVLYWVSSGSVIGGGDVKLMAAAGLFLGWELIVFGFLAGCIIGSVVHLIRMRFFHAGRELALGPYLAAGLFIAYLVGERLINWYINLLIL